jgi:predicted nucleic acid-binding protein
VAAYFLDSSALVKYYVQEQGSAWVRTIVNPAAPHGIFLSHLTLVEIYSAIARRVRGGSVSVAEGAQFSTDFASDVSNVFFVLDLTPDVCRDARFGGPGA